MMSRALHQLVIRSISEVASHLKSGRSQDEDYTEELFFRLNATLKAVRLFLREMAHDELAENASAPFLLLELGEELRAKEVFSIQAKEQLDLGVEEDLRWREAFENLSAEAEKRR